MGDGAIGGNSSERVRLGAQLDWCCVRYLHRFMEGVIYDLPNILSRQGGEIAKNRFLMRPERCDTRQGHKD